MESAAHYIPNGWPSEVTEQRDHDTGVQLAEDFHVYGLEWHPDEMRFYFDGELAHTIPNAHWHEPLYIFLDTEVWLPLPTPDQLPSRYEIDYIRVWENDGE